MYDSIVKPILVVALVVAIGSALGYLAVAIAAISSQGIAAMGAMTMNFADAGAAGSVNRVALMQQWFVSVGIPWSMMHPFFGSIPALIIAFFSFKGLQLIFK